MSCSSAPVTATSRSMPGNVALIALTACATPGSARAGRGGRPGGSTWPPAPRGSPPTAPSPRRTRARAARAGAGPGSSPISSRRSLSICSALARRSVEQIIQIEAAAARPLQAAKVDLRADSSGAPCSGRARGPASRPSRAPRPRRVVPDHARERAGAVAELQSQVVAAVAPLPALGAHEQNLVDLGAVAEFLDEHSHQGKELGGRDSSAVQSRVRRARDAHPSRGDQGRCTRRVLQNRSPGISPRSVSR